MDMHVNTLMLVAEQMRRERVAQADDARLARLARVAAREESRHEGQAERNVAVEPDSAARLAGDRALLRRARRTVRFSRLLGIVRNGPARPANRR